MAEGNRHGDVLQNLWCNYLLNYIFFVRSCCSTLLQITSKSVIYMCAWCAVLCWGLFEGNELRHCCGHTVLFPRGQEIPKNESHYWLWISLINIVVDLRVDVSSGARVSTRLNLMMAIFFRQFSSFWKDPVAAATAASLFYVLYLMPINHIAVYASASRDSVECIGVWLFVWGFA